MTDPYLGEIRMFAGSYAPVGWACCDGALLNIAQHQALFSIIGTTYGGDGRLDMALPDMQDRAPMGYGNTPYLSIREVGEKGGVASVSLQLNQLPSHIHQLMAATDSATTAVPADESYLAAASSKKGKKTISAEIFKAVDPETTFISMASDAIGATGGADKHENRQPFLAILFIISIDGAYPPHQT